MALPKIERPLFEVSVPIIDKKIKMRPYLVKEEKILLLAQQSEDIDQIVLATKQIINNCIVDGDIVVEELPNFIIEWLILQLRIQSVGDIVNTSYRDLEDDRVYDFEVDLKSVQMIVDDEHTDAFEITPNIGVIMKYPGIDTIRSIDITKDATEFSLDILITCIDKVFTDDEVIEFSDYPYEEKMDFLNQFSRDEMINIIKFFETSPKLGLDLTYTNSLGKDRKIELRGLNDFFI
jgi:hypothetical protein